MTLAIINGLITSIILETIILDEAKLLILRSALKNSIGNEFYFNG